MKLIEQYPYELLVFLWIAACFLVLLLKVPKGKRLKSFKEVAAVTALFAAIAAIVVVALGDGPDLIDELAGFWDKVLGKQLGG